MKSPAFLFVILALLLPACKDDSPSLNPPLPAGTTAGQVEQLIAKQLGRDVGSFNMDDPLASKLGAEDLDIVELVLAVEETFAIKIPDAELFEPADEEKELGDPKALTGNDFVRLVDKLQNQSASPPGTP